MVEIEMRNLFLHILISVFMSGCAIGNTHRYDLGDAKFNLNSDKTVAVTTLDLRPYVRSGDKSPNFVGLMRGGFGNPFDVLTSSGRPLAEDMTISIVEAAKAFREKLEAIFNDPKVASAFP